MWKIFEIYIINKGLISLKCKRAFKMKGEQKDQPCYKTRQER